jgi:hypothetical protein
MLKTIHCEISGRALAIALCLALGTGCAKIGEPQAPRIRVPRPAADLAARQLADSIVLTFSKPSQNTDGSAATTLARVDVFRLIEDASRSVSANPVSEDEFEKRAVRVLSIPSSDFSKYLQGESFVVQDKPHFPDGSSIYSHAYRYAVLFINGKNQTAGFSNQVLIAPVPIPLPPSGLSAKVTEDFINLQWTEPTENMDGSTPPRIEGFNIYRAEGTGDFEQKPINSALVKKPEFEDRNFHFDQIYRYRVRTVGSLNNPFAESLPSDIITVEARDVFPPAPPENFTAIREGGVIILLWAPSSSADVAGYRIYRRDNGTASRHLLQKDLITALNYRDSQVEPGRQYEYEIQAVDAHGNESAPARTMVETRQPARLDSPTGTGSVAGHGYVSIIET